LRDRGAGRRFARAQGSRDVEAGGGSRRPDEAGWPFSRAQITSHGAGTATRRGDPGNALRRGEGASRPEDGHGPGLRRALEDRGAEAGPAGLSSAVAKAEDAPLAPRARGFFGTARPPDGRADRILRTRSRRRTNQVSNYLTFCLQKNLARFRTGNSLTPYRNTDKKTVPIVGRPEVTPGEGDASRGGRWCFGCSAGGTPDSEKATVSGGSPAGCGG